jgi:ABC-2 type transport system ATP-binding protein
VVADGTPTEIKGRVGARLIRATLPGPDIAELSSLPGVSSAERHGESIALRCANSDPALRALLERYPDARDIEVRGGSLEEAFVELTGGEDDEAGTPGQAGPGRVEPGGGELGRVEPGREAEAKWQQ